MPRQKKNTNDSTTRVTTKEVIYCTGCDKDKPPKDFYRSYGTTASGVLPYCKDCCFKMSLDSGGNIDVERFKAMLIKVDRPYLHKIFIDTYEKNKDKPNGIIGKYFKNIGMIQYRQLKYRDSIFVVEDNEDEKYDVVVADTSLSIVEKQKLTDKWGIGYTDEELISFEKKYESLKDNYPQKTAMHTEALLIYIRYRVKEEFATARGDVSEAEKWGKLADKASERAKINPSQLSQADLSGGLNSFGEVSRAVERAKDIIPILPRFKEKPQDKVDFTLLCYINYIRRMKNLPDATYKDIWQFYEDRKNEYKKEPDREFKFEDEK